MKKKVELLAPAGDLEKLKVALHFGADAVYFAGKKFGLRAFAANFEDISVPVKIAHDAGKKAYITLNIYPRNNDIKEIIEYLKEIERVKPDGIIISDIGIMSLAKVYAPSVPIHVSTQANTTNIESAKAYVNSFGATRVVLARELPLKDIEKISKDLKKLNAETEVFVHGAMCISYSGRCLLSNYLTGRDSNKGECVQACRWGYSLVEREKNVNSNYHSSDEKYDILEDSNGTYILNSKDLCLARHLKELIDAGVSSFKIEGRMKSPYYLATVVNTYRQLIDDYLENRPEREERIAEAIVELEKSSHREFTTGFVVDDKKVRQNYQTSHQTQTSEFLGVVKDTRQVGERIEVLIEMRNRFKVGQVVEIISNSVAHNALLEIMKMETEDGNDCMDAKVVQQKLWVTFDSDNSLLCHISPLDMIRSYNPKD